MVTTLSGTYSIEEYEKIRGKVRQAFKDFWHGKLSIAEHKRILEESGLSYAEIKGAQYEASMEDKRTYENKN